MLESQPYYEAVGCIHIHSVYSDGSGTIPEITHIAEETGLDYIMITDHNNLRALVNGEEKWYGSVLPIIGYEINDIDNYNHYLAFGLKEEVNRNLSAEEYVHQVKVEGGFGIIAHPDEKRNVLPEHPPFPWTAWDSEDFQGIEIWNQMSEWMEGLKPWNKVWRFINPRKSIKAPVPSTLSRWDEANLERKVVGIGGVDAHAHKHKMFGGFVQVTIFRYKVQFQSVRTHLLLTQPLIPGMDVDKAKQLIYDAILNCRVFVSNYFNGDSRGLKCYAINENGIAILGEKLLLKPGTKIVIELPSKANINLKQNGKIIAKKEGRKTFFCISEPGLYRLEIYRGNRAWIFTNHIRILGETE
jgi:hypothetical protein